MNQPTDLSGRTALVTGGSRGIGRAISFELAARGAFVAVNYRSNATAADETVARINEQFAAPATEAAPAGDGAAPAAADAPPAAAAFQADVTEEAQVEAMLEALEAEEGRRVDILVNNAGITRDAYFMMMRRGQWDAVVDTHLNGTYVCTRALVRSLCAQGRGVVINIGSSAGLSPRAGQVNYSASKAGLLGFTRSLAREVADKGVRVLTVVPGFTRTDMAEQVPAKAAKEAKALIPLGRWAEPEEIAQTVAFFASTAAATMTGLTFVVDGGRVVNEKEYGLPK